MNDRLPQVGAPDDEQKNSPILDETAYDEQAGTPDAELEAAACWFNGESFPAGTRVQSGDEILECARGVWVKKGERHP